MKIASFSLSPPPPSVPYRCQDNEKTKRGLISWAKNSFFYAFAAGRFICMVIHEASVKMIYHIWELSASSWIRPASSDISELILILCAALRLLNVSLLGDTVFTIIAIL